MNRVCKINEQPQHRHHEKQICWNINNCHKSSDGLKCNHTIFWSGYLTYSAYSNLICLRHGKVPARINKTLITEGCWGLIISFSFVILLLFVKFYIIWQISNTLMPSVSNTNIKYSISVAWKASYFEKTYEIESRYSKEDMITGSGIQAMENWMQIDSN